MNVSTYIGDIYIYRERERGNIYIQKMYSVFVCNSIIYPLWADTVRMYVCSYVRMYVCLSNLHLHLECRSGNVLFVRVEPFVLLLHSSHSATWLNEPRRDNERIADDC